MKPSESSYRLQEIITKAIDDHKITREEYDLIIHTATEDGHVDTQERVLLEQLHDMIENKMIRFVAK